MPTRADVERLRVANAEISSMVRSEVERFWSTLSTTRYGAARQALIEYMPILVQQYGDLGASVAAEWYDEMRTASVGQSLRFRALPAGVAPTAQIEESTRWAIRDLENENAKGALLGVADRLVKLPGQDTISQNAAREGVRWARVPSGPTTCAFCLMLASRGFQDDYAYASRDSAQRRGRRQTQDKYHDWCDCVPTPSWGPHDRDIEGYDPDALYQAYLNARGDIANAHDTKGILSRLREQTGRR